MKIRKISRMVTAAVAAAMLLAVGAVGASAQLILRAGNPYVFKQDTIPQIVVFEIRDAQGNVVTPMTNGGRVSYFTQQFEISSEELQAYRDMAADRAAIRSLDAETEALLVKYGKIMSYNNRYVLAPGETADAYAVGDGEVVATEDFGDYGLIALIEHEGFYAFYSSIESTDLSVGDTVSAGQVIAQIGCNGEQRGLQYSFLVLHDGDELLEELLG
jgi:murein DD-endopeptidase MepM/ murein hydrolase activator NlpD